jgi:hypothetical protein
VVDLFEEGMDDLEPVDVRGQLHGAHRHVLPPGLKFEGYPVRAPAR